MPLLPPRRRRLTTARHVDLLRATQPTTAGQEAADNGTRHRGEVVVVVIVAMTLVHGTMGATMYPIVTLQADRGVVATVVAMMAMATSMQSMGVEHRGRMPWLARDRLVVVHESHQLVADDRLVLLLLLAEELPWVAEVVAVEEEVVLKNARVTLVRDIPFKRSPVHLVLTAFCCFVCVFRLHLPSL